MNEETFALIQNTLKLAQASVDKMTESNRKWFCIILTTTISSSLLIAIICMYAINQMYK